MDSSSIDVLLVEDSPADADTIRRQLEPGPHGPQSTLRVATTLGAGIAEAKAAAPDVVLLDLNLPDSDGLDSVKAMVSACPDLAVVVLTGVDDDAIGLAAVNLGAEDFVVKGETDPARLGRLLRFAIERHRAVASLRGLSTIDELTGIYNRRGFLSLAARHFIKSRPPSASCALFFVDIDSLKMINDTHGHAAGDEAIAGAAEVLRRVFRPSDVLGRLGGDEFAVLRLVPGLGPPEVAVAKLREEAALWNAGAPRPWKLSLSVGFSRLADEATTLEDMLVEADKRMYEAKGRKRMT